MRLPVSPAPRPGPRTHLHQGRSCPEAHLGHGFTLASPREPAEARAGAGEGAEGSGTRRDRCVRSTQAVSRVIRHAEGPAPGQGVYDLADGRRRKSQGQGHRYGGSFPPQTPPWRTQLPPLPVGPRVPGRLRRNPGGSPCSPRVPVPCCSSQDGLRPRDRPQGTIPGPRPLAWFPVPRGYRGALLAPSEHPPPPGAPGDALGRGGPQPQPQEPRKRLPGGGSGGRTFCMPS